MEQKMKSEHIDPLVIIFEKYVYDFPSESLDEFIETIVNEYLNFLGAQNVVVPEKNRSSLLKDLVDEVYDMYIKKVHGCLNLNDYQRANRVTKLEKLIARDRYLKLTGTG